MKIFHRNLEFDGNDLKGIWTDQEFFIVLTGGKAHLIHFIREISSKDFKFICPNEYISLNLFVITNFYYGY